MVWMDGPAGGWLDGVWRRSFYIPWDGCCRLDSRIDSSRNYFHWVCLLILRVEFGRWSLAMGFVCVAGRWNWVHEGVFSEPFWENRDEEVCYGYGNEDDRFARSMLTASMIFVWCWHCGMWDWSKRGERAAEHEEAIGPWLSVSFRTSELGNSWSRCWLLSQTAGGGPVTSGFETVRYW